MRAVLDTNVLISGLLWRGAPHQCLLSAEAGLFDLVLAEAIFDELREKLIVKFDNSEAEAEQAIAGLRRCATLAPLSGRSGWLPADPDDDKFVETALEGNATIIVSGDHHLLEQVTIEGLSILSPRAFLEQLRSGGE